MTHSYEGTVFSTSRVLPFSPAVVYAAFADSAKLAQWWGPAGFRNTFEVFEFKPGGHWKFVMHGPDGANYPNESHFIELQPPTKLVIQHVNQPRFKLTVTLEEAGSATKLHWAQAFEDSQVAANVRHIVEPANEQNLDRLTAVLAGKAV
jgi:uncharacterized protein YndB with AHSA1/START domain